MKTFTRTALTIVGVAILLASCSKDQLDDTHGKKKKTTAVCDVASFTQQYTNGETRYIFNKVYDLSGSRLSHIDAGLYSGGVIWDTVHLDVTFNSNLVYFISSQNASDTGLVVTLDNAGRVTRADVGQMIDGGFGPQVFSYRGNKLDLINIDDNWMRIWFKYDEKGNNSQIVTDSTDGVPRINHVYEYDKKKKGSQQFYLDEARGFSFNVLTILQGAGFFPGLNPVNARTRTTVHWGPYQAYDFAQIDHVFDNGGRLMQYKTASPGGNSPVATHSVNYNCAISSNELITYAY